MVRKVALIGNDEWRSPLGDRHGSEGVGAVAASVASRVRAVTPYASAVAPSV